MRNLKRNTLVIAIVVGLTTWVLAQATDNQSAAIAQMDDSWSCPCDHLQLDSLAYPMCSLCREAERQPANAKYFFLKDIDPRKPNRWLILPRAHTKGMQHLSDLNAADSGKFWTAAIKRAQELWGKQWGLAVNGDGARSQCHAHVHIGKLLDGAENGEFLVKGGWAQVAGKAPLTFKRPEQIKVPANGEAFWIHPSGDGFHLHIEDPSTAAEFVLMR